MNIAAKKYAEAFFSLGLQLDKVRAFKKDCQLIESSFDLTDGILGFLSCVDIPKEEKKNILAKSFEGQIDKMSMNFLFVLVDKNRASEYKEIFHQYYQLANPELGIKEGYVESVRPLDEKRIKALEDALSTKELKVELKQRINDNLISGFRVVFDGEIIDASMKEKVRKMNEMLLGKDGSLWN